MNFWTIYIIVKSFNLHKNIKFKFLKFLQINK